LDRWDTNGLCDQAILCLENQARYRNGATLYLDALRDSTQADVRRAIRLACTPKRKAKK